MDTLENSAPSMSELQRFHQRSLANEAFLTQQILGAAEKGNKTFDQLKSELAARRAETIRLAHEITGDPSKGVVLPQRCPD